MNIITGRHLERRTFLKGMGASVALPFLDAMVPAGRLAAGAVEDPTRFVAIELVHGAAGLQRVGCHPESLGPGRRGS